MFPRANVGCAVIEIGPVCFSDSEMVVKGADVRASVRVDPAGLTISEVVEHGFHVEGVVRCTRVPASDVEKFVVLLPFRRKVWARTVAVLCDLAPAGLSYDGNVTRVDCEGVYSGQLRLGRREDWIISKRLSIALEVWTEVMSSWSMTWSCNETAFEAFLGVVGDQRLPRRRLRLLVAEIQSLGDPDENPPPDLAESLQRQWSG